MIGWARRPPTASGSVSCGRMRGAAWARLRRARRRAQSRGRAQADPGRARRRPGQPARFLLEAEITGGLEHPGIVPVYGLGTYADGRPLLRDAVHPGRRLKEAIASFHADETLKNDPGRRSLELRKLLRRFIDVCNAIDYAHSRGVLHRDIKPGNVIVGKYGETLVVDWGLAKATGRSDPVGRRADALAQLGQRQSPRRCLACALGTPAYMSPEQAAGRLERLGPASDVYSLGATLYCLLTGKPPIEGDDVGDVLRAVQRGNFSRPGGIDPTIDQALEAVCMKAMALEPADRYATPKALADDIERWMADEPRHRLARALDPPGPAMGAAKPDGGRGRRRRPCWSRSPAQVRCSPFRRGPIIELKGDQLKSWPIGKQAGKQSNAESRDGECTRAGAVRAGDVGDQAVPWRGQ